MDVSATNDHFGVDQLVGLRSAHSLTCNLLELSCITSNRCAEVSYLFGFLICYTSHHEDDKGVGLTLAVTLGDEGVLQQV